MNKSGLGSHRYASIIHDVARFLTSPNNSSRFEAWISSWAVDHQQPDRAGRGMTEQSGSVDPWTEDLKRNIAVGLRLLLEANALAGDLDRSGRDFGVEIQSLRQVGLNESCLRWLIRKGSVEHLLDTTLPGEIERAIRPVRTERFVDASCFALTQTGVLFAALLPESSPTSQVVVASPLLTTTGSVLIPVWDLTLRELRFGETIIKKYRVPAPNQVLILSAFQEEDWPSRIDDPLPPKPGIEPSTRLSKTVYRMNRSLDPPLIHFSDRLTGVFWTDVGGNAGGCGECHELT